MRRFRYTFLFTEGLVNYFAVQEPEDDPRPIVYFWCAVDAHKRYERFPAELCLVLSPSKRG